MPSSYETISRTKHGDYTQTTRVETEEGSLHVSIGGPSGLFELEVESPEDLPGQIGQRDQIMQAIADARATFASFLDCAEGGQP